MKKHLSQSAPKPVKAWAIISPTMGLVPQSVHDTRDGAWAGVGCFPSHRKTFLKQGYRCIRVLITPA